MNCRIACFAIAILCFQAQAQTLDDGIMMGRGMLCAGYMYTHDSWHEYWEGALQRTNDNLGTVTTEAHSIYGIYGLTNSFNVVALVPHVRTNASQGVLAGQRGWQDATLGAKVKFYEAPVGEIGRIRAIAVVSASLPMSDYTPDFLPLSIGMNTRRTSARAIAHFRTGRGYFLNATGAWSWRNNVHLDRPYYYADNQLVMSDSVPMRDVFDYQLSGGFIRGELVLSAGFNEQRTQGGDDIRRNDMPFVSNRMNFSRVNLWAKVPLPRHDALSLVGGYSDVLDGRNVGKSTTLTAGLMYLFSFRGGRH